MLDKKRLGLIGAGQMGEAIISGLIAHKTLSAAQIVASEPDEKKRGELAQRYGIKTVFDNAQAVQDADIVILAVKPQTMISALASVKGKLKPSAILVSIIAGVRLETLEAASGHASVIRVMPNTPARIGKGISMWISSKSFPEESIDAVQTLLASMGQEIRVKDESALDMATAISGSGPAYVFLFMEAMIDAGVHIGLTRDIATKLVAHTVAGSAEFMIQSGEHPALLRNQVTSPAGTTAAALCCLEGAGMRDALSEAVWAAFERARELSRGESGSRPR